MKIYPSGTSKVNVYAPNFGNVSSVENLDPTGYIPSEYFKKMIDFLVNKLGYDINENLFAAAYDFRKAPGKNSFTIPEMEFVIKICTLIK